MRFWSGVQRMSLFHQSRLCDDDLVESSYIQEQLGIKCDWMNRVSHCMQRSGITSSVPRDGVELARAIANFEGEMGLMETGIIGAKTRMALIEHFPGLRIQFVGTFLEPKILLNNASESEVYFYFKNIVRSQFGTWCEHECVPFLVGLRGVHWDGVRLKRTESAKVFASSVYGAREHLRSNKADYFDSVIGVFWRESGACHACIFSAVVNPASVWSGGTAHLNNGQYTYRIGRHRTREPEHMAAIRRYALEWDKSWIFEDTGDSVQYIALVGTRPIEVVRSSGSSLDLSLEDIARAELAIAERRETYVNGETIRINIHSCAEKHASSLGCQNIAPWDYRAFMSLLLRLADGQRRLYGCELPISYFLTDSSFIAE